MRIYNAKKAQIDLPLAGNTRIVIPGHSVSRDIMPSDQFLTMISQSFENDEIALIIAGPFEVNLCAKNPSVQPLIVNSLDEAISRFNEKGDSVAVEKPAEPEPEPEPEVEFPKVEEPTSNPEVIEPEQAGPVVEDEEEDVVDEATFQAEEESGEKAEDNSTTESFSKPVENRKKKKNKKK